ncbi:MAG: hypothetical protein MZV64_49620 [Ignavibacteriales bacterium]|nr:hypothetical protein [Ignavibacteriales bacterium]
MRARSTAASVWPARDQHAAVLGAAAGRCARAGPGRRAWSPGRWRPGWSRPGRRPRCRW